MLHASIALGIIAFILCFSSSVCRLSRAERETAFTELGFSRQTPVRTKGKAERYLVCVSVVVVVVGPGTVVCSDVVDLLLCVESEAQPDTNATATTIRYETISFFIHKV
jgi:hypothetical protein